MHPVRLQNPTPHAHTQELENRLFSEGLHVLGAPPTQEQAAQYLSAYFGDDLPEGARRVKGNVCEEHAPPLFPVQTGPCSMHIVGFVRFFAGRLPRNAMVE